MGVGAMRERVTFSTPNIQPNGQGGARLDKNNPIIIGEVWAAVEVISGVELVKYGGRFSEAYIKIEARTNKQVSKSCLVTWQNVVYDIEEITPAKNKPGYSHIYAREAAK